VATYVGTYYTCLTYHSPSTITAPMHIGPMHLAGTGMVPGIRSLCTICCMQSMCLFYHIYHV